MPPHVERLPPQGAPRVSRHPTEKHVADGPGSISAYPATPSREAKGTRHPCHVHNLESNLGERFCTNCNLQMVLFCPVARFFPGTFLPEGRTPVWQIDFQSSRTLERTPSEEHRTGHPYIFTRRIFRPKVGHGWACRASGTHAALVPVGRFQAGLPPGFGWRSLEGHNTPPPPRPLDARGLRLHCKSEFKPILHNRHNKKNTPIGPQ